MIGISLIGSLFAILLAAGCWERGNIGESIAWLSAAAWALDSWTVRRRQR